MCAFKQALEQGLHTRGPDADVASGGALFHIEIIVSI